jgi:N-acetylglucosamine-6-phosphate deacetylase
MGMTLTAKRLVTANAILDEPLITIEDGLVASVTSRSSADGSNPDCDFADATVTAGLLDIHMHGALGYDVMDDDPAALGTISKFLASRGVTSFLATTVTASMDYTLRALDNIARHIERGPAANEAALLGIHIEGPFLSHAKKGMHPPQYLLLPSPDVLERLFEAARGLIKVMTVAPELPGATETIERACELGIRCSIGHSNANAAEARQGIEAGATSATHTFNAMRALDHREPGILGVVLDSDFLYSDLICDGVHVAPEMVRLWWKAKGPERAILITDSLQAAGMPDGVYRLGETPVYVKGPRCTTEEGVLAGSVLTLDEAVAKMRQFTGIDLPAAVRLASRNPARLIGVPDDLPGHPANFNVFDEEGRRMATVLRGDMLAEN